jgi:hypothetical protein
VALAVVVSALLLLGSGCGEEGGAASGATVTAYVAAPLCGDAKRELADQGARAGDVQVRLFCLARTGGRRLDLAAVGANARRASEDSSSVGYLEQPGPAARFSATILEAAGIAQVEDNSGATAMARLLRALREADSGSPREAVREALDPAA